MNDAELQELYTLISWDFMGQCFTLISWDFMGQCFTLSICCKT